MKSRQRIIELASIREYDLVVIGGGIVGAGVAQDAASRGLSVLLIEKDDFASHTSSKTTKLIHGGLKYLETGQLKLTYELSKERELLEQLAPHLVKDISLVLPLINGETFFSWKASIGLSIYDLLSFNFSHGATRHERLNPREVLEAAPAISASNIVGGLRFHDAITDDARLVLTVLKSAVGQGAHVINYMEAASLKIESNLVRGIECRDRLNGNILNVRCKTCVNAAGIFSDQILRLLKGTWESRTVPAKGIHIVLPLSAFPTNTGLFLPSTPGRYVFVLPWQRALMVGTTDDIYKGDLDNPLANSDEIDYLLNVMNQYTEKSTVNRSDIISAWAGIRPLVSPHDNAIKDTTRLSREHKIFVGPKGLVCIIGGKLTNYRLMAEQVVDRLFERFPGLTSVGSKSSRTKRLILGGWLDKNDFLVSSALIASRGRRLSLDPATIDHLTSTYGKEALAILDLVEENGELKERISPEFPPLMAEITYSVQNEMAISLEDFLSRRIRLAILDHKQCMEAAPKVARQMQALLGWDGQRLGAELESLQDSLSKQLPSPFLAAG